MRMWLLKRCSGGSGSFNVKEDDNTDDVANWQKQKMMCVKCGKRGHLAWNCYKLTPASRESRVL